jgi:hypothetical protein
MGIIISYLKKEKDACIACDNKCEQYFKYENEKYCGKCYEYLILMTDSYEVATF